MDVLRRALFGALENHVFEKMRNTTVRGRLVHRADADPDIENGHGRAGTRRQQDSESIVQRKRLDLPDRLFLRRSLERGHSHQDEQNSQEQLPKRALHQ